MNTEERLPAPNGVLPFERIRRTHAAGAEFWSSQDFEQVLGYSDFRNFEQAMKRAKTACFNSGQGIKDHFGEIVEMVGEGMKKLESKRRKPAEALWHSLSEMGRTDTLRSEGIM